jgi:hypothetical protein
VKNSRNGQGQKYATNNSLGILGQPDSTELWTEIISQAVMDARIRYAMKHNGKILVIAGGHGTEVDVLVEKYGKNIVKNIWFNDDIISFANEIKFKYNKINIIKSNFLEINIDMKFDVIVGNPPYDAPLNQNKQTKKIWQEFIHKALDLLNANGTLSLLCPPSWILSNDAKLKKVRNRIIGNNITHLRLGVQEYFPTVDIQIAYFILQQKPYEKITKFIDQGETDSTDINLEHGIPLKPEEQYRNDLVDKIIQSSQDKYKWSSYGEDIKKSTDAAQKLNQNNKLLKLIINYSKAYYSENAKDHNMPITRDPINNLQVCLTVKTKNEGLKHKSWLHSKAIRWFANNFKRRGQTGFCDAVKRQVIPKFKTQLWTNGEVYKVLKLNDKEISYIESNL